jgi:heptaprenyl diphosphate synthase
MRETRGPRPGEDPVSHYLAVVAEKTGSLIATAGRYGAMFAGCPPEQVTALRRFGEIIGTAFQVSDDVIDIASPEESSGKTPGTDLREGVPTLPMLYALQDSGPSAARLRELLAAPLTDNRLVDEALGLLRAGDGLELAALPECPAREALASLTTYVVDRTG